MMEVSAGEYHQETETSLDLFKMTENLVGEETDGHPKDKNPPSESDFYCQLCAVDSVNNTGKLLHSLDPNHIEAYLLSLKMTPKRKPTFQDKSVIKSKWNQVNTPKVEFEPGGQHLVCDAQVGEEDRKHAITKEKNEGDLLNNMLLNDLKFSILHSQSSTPRQSVERILAEQTQEKITIHGKEVQIKKNRKKPNKGLQNFKLPKKVKDLFSSEEKFLNDLDKFIASFQLDLPDIDNQQAVCKSVTSSLQNFAPRVYPYGSRITGLAFKDSDLDIFVNITKPYQYFKNKYQRHIQELIIHDAAQDIMCSSDFCNVVEIPKASVPLISCKHVPTGFKCDLTFCYPFQVYNTGLTILYLSVDYRVRPLILLIRYWASAHGLLGKGKFSSYSLNLMCIFYLQQIPEKPILPSVSLLMKLARDHERVSYGYWDCGYCEDISLIPKSVNDSSLFHLVKGFFKFYAELDTNNIVVCPFIGKSAQKTIFNPGMEQILPIEFEKYKSNCLEGLTEPLNVDHVLCIQDPFVHNCNVAKQNRKHIVERFQICCGLYTQEQD